MTCWGRALVRRPLRGRGDGSGTKSDEMGLIGLTEVHAGMILRADVVAQGDRLLLGAGAELSEGHLRIFSMWGVTAVDVEGGSAADVTAKAAAELSPAERAAVEARMDALWRHNDRRDPIVAALVGLTTLRAARRAAGGRYGP